MSLVVHLEGRPKGGGDELKNMKFDEHDQSDVIRRQRQDIAPICDVN